MGIDLNRVSQLVRGVDVLAELEGYSSNMSEDRVNELVDKALSITNATFTHDELEAVKRDISWKYQILASPGQSIVDDYDQEKWYDNAKKDIDAIFWTRYKNFLIDEKKFSPNIVSTLGEETLDQKLMNYLGNPSSRSHFFKRGLIIGDVQSGKTSTYIGLICKAADAGYKVFILLTGTIESLRKQTQERVEEGFIGINMSADGKRVGVGLDNKPIHAMAITSRSSDFTGNSDKIAVSLADKDAVVFVIKKNSDVLKKLTEWLINLNADPGSKRIDLPMLLIDDEADNASVNTSTDKESPTKINKMIRDLANVFTKSNYVGFTATPFANVFIDPETTETMKNQDLFPEDFIVALPTPSNYIGPSQIFASGGKYHSQLRYIIDAGREENDGWPFYFKHKKNWDDDLPNSLTDSLFTFYIANAIRDLRGDRREHRSMLINMSRFVKVQYKIKEQIEQLHSRAYRSIKFNLSLDENESMKDPIIKRIYKNWELNYSDIEFGWNEIINVLFSAIENIQIKVVNSSKNSEKLEYPQNESIRVIAIGGLALSRGLTLEGLVISYFFRNTCTYDVLMQMGRWFGYRKNYDDLFRIWTNEDSADWYAEIAESTEMLKLDMEKMKEVELKPKDFGIRVRSNCDELRITAPNKMRNVTDEYEFESYFGGMIETPYVIYDSIVQKNNFNQVIKWTENSIHEGYTMKLTTVKGVGTHHVIFGVPKSKIIQLLFNVKISKYSSNFDVQQINTFLESYDGNELDLWNIAFMDGNRNEDKKIEIDGKSIYKVVRKKCKFDTTTSRLTLGEKGKLGGPTDGMMGLEDYKNLKVEDIINDAQRQYALDYKEKFKLDFTPDKSYTSETWFKYISDRKPLLIIYFVDVEAHINSQMQGDKFKEELGGDPVTGFAIGFPKNDVAATISKNKYKANKVYNWFEKDDILAESVEVE